MKGFDCAAPLTASLAAAFKADGYDFVVRYIDTHPSSWKRITSNEAQIISDNGLKIISVFERQGDRTGINGLIGETDGLNAMQAAQDIGQPEGSTIYFAVDYDAQPNDMDNIEAYIRAAASATPIYPTGIYGSYAVIEEMQKRGACSHFWQTYAWSGNLQSAYIQMYQYSNDITVQGIDIDLNISFGNEGWWNTMPLIPISDANKIIGLLGEAYKLGVTRIPLPDGTTAIVDQAEIHRLANVLRTASGQPVS